MLEIRGLTKRFQENGRPVLDGIDLSFPECGLYYFLGKSGSGKTTLFSILGAMETDYEGSIRYQNKELKEMTEKEREDYRFYDVSFVFQDYSSMEEESVEENLLHALDITEMTEDEKRRRIHDVLKEVGLDGKKEMLFKDVSGGEKKRISLARGLLRPSRILFVDEPVSSLNPLMRKEITRLLVRESQRRLVLVITHEKDSIPEEATVKEIIDGKIISGKVGKRIESKGAMMKAKRTPLSLFGQWKSAFRFFRSHIRFLSFVFFSLTLALFSSTFSFQLSTTISASLKESFSHYMKDNTMVVEQKEDGLVRDSYRSLSHQELLYYQNRYPQYVLSENEFYLTSLNDLFRTGQICRLLSGNRQINVPRISLDSFLASSVPEEKEVELRANNYREDEIALLLEEESFSAFYVLLKGEKPKELDKAAEQELNDILSYRNVSLRLTVDKGEWNYHLDHSFRVREVFSKDETAILSPDSEFASHFVHDVLHFKERFEEEKGEYPPWTLLKCSGLRLRRYALVDFLMDFLRDPYSDSFTVELLRPSSYYKENDKATHNRIGVYLDCHSRMSVHEMEELQEKFSDRLSDLSFSSSLYTYTASGYISGFLRPYFFSRYKDRLNKIQDENAYSEADLFSMQGSLIQPEEAVYKSDLLSSMEGGSILFSSKEGKQPSFGVAPHKASEIGISQGLAETVFHRPEEALGETLHVLTIAKTEKEKGRYRNVFLEDNLTITAIYPGKEKNIVQDPLFPLCYAYSLSEERKDSFSIREVTFSVERRKDSSHVEESLKQMGYRFSFPMRVMLEEIDHTLSLLSIVFLSLSLFSFLSSGFVMGLSFFLILSKNTRGIGVLLSLGYHRSEISRYYFFLLFLLTLSSYLSSLIFSSYAEKMILSTLSLSSHSYQGRFLPYLISFLFASFLVACVSIFLSFRIRKISPKEALRRGNV